MTPVTVAALKSNQRSFTPSFNKFGGGYNHQGKIQASFTAT